MFECSRQLTKSQLENIEKEKEISRRIDMLPKSKSDLPYFEKREIVQNELHNSKNYKEIPIDLQNNTIKCYDKQNPWKNTENPIYKNADNPPVFLHCE
jgi:hypothetical protein